MTGILIDERLVRLGMGETAKEAAIRSLAGGLYELDCVHEGYVENVLAREEVYPTGLPAWIPVAICHTEARFVKRSALAVGTLAAPIAFQEMGTPERTVAAEVIFLLALADPKEQVPWLKKLAGVFKDRETLAAIRDAPDPASLVRLLKTVFPA